MLISDGSIQIMSVIDGAIIRDVKVYTPASIDNTHDLNRSI